MTTTHSQEMRLKFNSEMEPHQLSGVKEEKSKTPADFQDNIK